MRARGNEIIFLGLNQSPVFFYIEPYVARSIMSTAINSHTHNITLMYRCWVSTGDVIMCVHGQSEVHLLRREVSPPPESSNVSGRFGNTCALLSLCLSLTLTADTEARNVIYALHWINTILHWIAGNFRGSKLSRISSFNGYVFSAKFGGMASFGGGSQ